MNLNLTVSELSDLLRKKEISPRDLVTEAYERIERLEPRVHAFITLKDRKTAIKQAENASKTLSDTGSILHGLPYVLKDAYVTEGLRTTAASKVLDNFLPPYTATVVRKLDDAGAICIAKANMDAWGHGASTENTDYPPTRNPWDTTRSAGGSGGGPAAAISARFATFGIGEDTGGSIRNPASWCGISALKVTYGRVSRYGAIAYASSLDTVGPTAKTVRECADILRVIAGKDPYDATSSPEPVPDYPLLIERSVRGMRIAWPKEFYGDGVDPEIVRVIEHARQTFTGLGVTVSDVSLPVLRYGVPVYYILAPSETSSNLARYDGVRYGGSRDMFTRETVRRILTGTHALSSGYYDAFYKNAQKARSLFIEKFSSLLSDYDAIMTPVMPTLPLKFGELLDDPVRNMMADLFTVTVNIVGSPSLALPAGFSSSGLPIGMQLIGKMFDEPTVLALGHAYQRETDWHRRVPEPQ